MKNLLVICGPTSTGKTDVAIKIAKETNGELVSADSRQVYKGMDIGTGKDIDSNTEYRISNIKYLNGSNIRLYLQNGIPIWLYDIVKPDEDFSVALYQKIAIKVIKDIWNRKRLPIVVGGTGLYIKSLLEPMETTEIKPNSVLRKRLSQKTLMELQKMLEDIDPQIWGNLNISDRNNARRLIRKIEIVIYTKKQKEYPLSKTEQSVLFDSVNIFGLTASHQELYKRIDERVDKRVSQGIVYEIQLLLNKGYDWNLPSLSSLGYKEWKEYFNNPTSVEQSRAIERWKFDEHAYARRQKTYFNKLNGIQWLDILKTDIKRSIVSTLEN